LTFKNSILINYNLYHKSKQIIFYERNKNKQVLKLNKINQPYKYGFETIEKEIFPSFYWNEEIVELISAKKENQPFEKIT
jgi:hypothetical protein